MKQFLMIERHFVLPVTVQPVLGIMSHHGLSDYIVLYHPGGGTVVYHCLRHRVNDVYKTARLIWQHRNCFDFFRWYLVFFLCAASITGKKKSNQKANRLLLADNGVYCGRGGLGEFNFCFRSCGKMGCSRTHGAQLLCAHSHPRCDFEGKNLVDPRECRTAGAHQQARDLAEDTIGAAAHREENTASRRDLSQDTGRYDIQLEPYRGQPPHP